MLTHCNNFDTCISNIEFEYISFQMRKSSKRDRT